MTTLNMTFTFELPDDEYYYSTINKAYQYRSVLTELFRELRSKAKHGEEGSGSYAEAYDLLWECMKDEELTWEDVV